MSIEVHEPEEQTRAVEHHGSPGHLEVAAGQSQWTDDQRAALKQLGLADATDADLKVFMHQAQRTGLDPFSRQIYMISRWDSQSNGYKYTIQTGIDGFRVIANRHPQYGGQVGPQWCGPDGVWQDVWVSDRPPAAARVGIIRKDWDEPVWGVAMFREYAQTKKNGEYTQMWATKGAVMIAKCAEALGFRKAFPFDLSGMYTDDEMGNASEPGAARRRYGRAAAQSSVSAAELRGTAIDVTAQPEAMTADQAKRIGDAFKAAGVSDRAARARIVDSLTDRPISGPGDLSHDEAASLIAELEDMGAEDIAALADVPQQTQVEWPEVNGPADGGDQS